MAVPAYQQTTDSVYFLRPVHGSKKIPTVKRQSACVFAFFLITLLFISICAWQTLQVRQLADYTQALRNDATVVQLEQERVLSDIRARL